MAFGDPIENSPEHQPAATETKEAHAERLNSTIENLVSNYIPEQDYAAIAAERAGTTVDKLPEEWRGWVGSQQLNQMFSKDAICRRISQAGIDEKDLPQYVEKVFAFQDELSKIEPEESEDINSMRYAAEFIIDSSESVQDIELWGKVLQEWKQLIPEDATVEERKKKIGDLTYFIKEMSGSGRSPKPPRRTQEEVEAQLVVYKEVKNYLYHLPEDTAKNPAVVELQSMYFNLGVIWHDPEQSKLFFELFEDTQQETRVEVVAKFLHAVARYGSHHKLTPQSLQGFEEKLLPAIEHGEPQVAVLQEAGNVWGMAKGDYGIGDFTVGCYALEVSPKNINQLLMALREVPTTNVARLEQNRRDAFRTPFGSFRDFIHDQRPLVREVVQAMVRYYETGDRADLEVLLPKTEGYLGTQERQAQIYDLANYDKEVEADVYGKKVNEKVIDVLRRLEENTKIVDEQPPVTSNVELNQCLQDFQREDVQATQVLQRALDALNIELEEAIKNSAVGIEPNTILAIAWLERKGFEALQGLDYESQQSAYTKPWFHALLKFQELTASGQPYNAEEFNKFIAKLSRTKDLKEAYKAVMARTLSRVSELAKVYSKTSKSHISGALWSGNIAHELTALTDLRPATTAYGEKHKKEQEVPFHLRNTGD